MWLLCPIFSLHLLTTYIDPLVTRYTYVETLGRDVYLCRCLDDAQLYVIKYIQLQGLSDKQKTFAQREAQLLAEFRYPCIVSYKEALFEENMYLLIVMQHCAKGDLSQAINKAAPSNYFSEEQILDWFAQVALALNECHRKNILHRDLKTQNVFVCHDGRIKLGDFGISKVLEHTEDFAHTGIVFFFLLLLCSFFSVISSFLFFLFVFLFPLCDSFTF